MQNLQSTFFENAIHELREFFSRNKEKEEDFELECTENEFIMRIKPSTAEQFEMEEDFEPIYEETEINSQVSEEFIDDGEEKYFVEEHNEVDEDQNEEEEEDDTVMDIVQDTISETSINEMTLKTEHTDDTDMKIIVDNLDQEQDGYSCECGSYFATLKQLQSHRAAKHSRKNTNTQYVCDTCSISFKEEKFSRIHAIAHESFEAIVPELSSFLCSECQFMFSNEEDLIMHIDMHEKKFQEVEMGYIDRISAFEDHFIKNEKHNGEEEYITEDEPIFTCGHCGIKKTEFNIKMHLLFFHTNVVFCPYENRCFEGHKQVRQFADHIRNKHPEIFNKKVEYVCTCCDAKFSTPFEKLAHMKTCNMKKFVCDKHCGKRFKSEWLLNNHLKFIENGGDKRFSCTLCSKQCVSKSDLQIHMRSHTNERPYQCKSLLFVKT